MQIVKPPLFDYLDYRKYLQDYYGENKRRNPAFSLRYFASLAGLKSYNYLKLVIDGERRLSETFLEPFARALKLTAPEQAYFRAMVAFGDADPAGGEKEARLEALLALRPKSALYRIDRARLQALKEWFYLPLLELTTTEGFQDDPQWIARRLAITPAQARRAVEDLTLCGMLERRAGQLRKTQRISDTLDEVAQIAVRLYHQKNLEIAARKVLEQDLHEREFGSISFAAPPERVAALKEKIKAFRREVFEILEAPCPRGGEVFQINVQLFRVTEPQKKPKPETETSETENTGVPDHETSHA